MFLIGPQAQQFAQTAKTFVCKHCNSVKRKRKKNSVAKLQEHISTVTVTSVRIGGLQLTDSGE